VPFESVGRLVLLSHSICVTLSEEWLTYARWDGQRWAPVPNGRAGARKPPSLGCSVGWSSLESWSLLTTSVASPTISLGGDQARAMLRLLSVGSLGPH
jgi:hypothetical protein